MASNLSLRSLLDSNKLQILIIKYCKFRIVLEHKKILYVTTDLAPQVLAFNTDVIVRDTYQKWLNDCTIVCCKMRASMSDEFSYKFANA